jgi:hypothetical protein
MNEDSMLTWIQTGRNVDCIRNLPNQPFEKPPRASAYADHQEGFIASFGDLGCEALPRGAPRDHDSVVADRGLTHRTTIL